MLCFLTSDLWHLGPSTGPQSLATAAATLPLDCVSGAECAVEMHVAAVDVEDLGGGVG